MRRNAADRHADLTSRFSHALSTAGFSPSRRWAIAVSGGGDSIALMHLAAEWAAKHASPLPGVVTVDHGLRQDSKFEACAVTAWAAALGLEATALCWSGPKPRTGIEEKARSARYRLMGEWCRSRSIAWLLLGHTRDDQAENFLLRLGRGSGVDGLSGMLTVLPLPVRGVESVRLLRPLLDIGRVELRDYLIERRVEWLEDPMNADPRFARARIRQLIPALAEAGISTNRIVSASRHLARARLALDAAAQYFLQHHAQFCSTGVAIDGTALADLPREIGLRALSAVLLGVAGASYRPRFERLERLFDALTVADFRRLTLAGCCIGRAPQGRAAYGPRTIWVVAEKPRRSAGQADGKNRSGKDLPEPNAAGD